MTMMPAGDQPTSPAATTPPLPRVLIFGDSLAAALAPPGFDVTVASHFGATTWQLIHDAPSLQHYLTTERYDAVVLLAGTNDLGHGSTPDSVVRALLEMARTVQLLGIVPIVCSLLHDAFNEVLLEQAPLALGVCYFLEEDIDTTFLADDGLHLNAAGRAELSKALAEVLHVEGVRQRSGSEVAG